MSTKQKTHDLPRLVAAINHKSTGCSPTICNRLKDAALKLGSGPLDSQALAAKLSLKRHPAGETIRAGTHLGILTAQPQRAAHGHPAPDLLSLNVARLKSIRPSTRKPTSAFNSLSREHRQLLERCDP